MKTELSVFIESKFKDIEQAITARLYFMERPSTCHELPLSVSSELCLGIGRADVSASFLPEPKLLTQKSDDKEIVLPIKAGQSENSSLIRAVSGHQPSDLVINDRTPGYQPKLVQELDPFAYE